MATVSIDEIGWSLRYELREMIRRGEDGILRLPPDQPAVTGPAPVATWLQSLKTS